jgi:cell division cycle protein 20 (cofactor of APC complex)
MQLKRRMGGHSARVGALSWNNHIVTSGGRDSLIVNHDVRVRQHDIQTFQGVHEQEICGLRYICAKTKLFFFFPIFLFCSRWSPDGTQLASGGNDNLMCVWEMGNDQPRLRRAEHTAAVKVQNKKKKKKE